MQKSFQEQLREYIDRVVTEGADEEVLRIDEETGLPLPPKWVPPENVDVWNEAVKLLDEKGRLRKPDGRFDYGALVAIYTRKCKKRGLKPKIRPEPEVEHLPLPGFAV